MVQADLEPILTMSFIKKEGFNPPFKRVEAVRLTKLEDGSTVKEPDN